MANQGCYGQVEEYDASGVTLDIPTAGTYVTWTTGTDRHVLNMTEAAGVFTVAANRGGMYRITVSGSTSGTNAAVLKGAIHVEGVAQGAGTFHVTMAATAIPVPFSKTMLANLSGGDTVDFRWTAGTNGHDVIFQSCTLVLEQVV